MQNVLVGGILNQKVVAIGKVGLLLSAWLTDVKVGMELGLVPLGAYFYFFLTTKADDIVFAGIVVLPQLVAQAKPAFAQIVVPSKELDLIGCRHQEVNECVDLLWFLTFLPYLSHNQIITYL